MRKGCTALLKTRHSLMMWRMERVSHVKVRRERGVSHRSAFKGAAQISAQTSDGWSTFCSICSEPFTHTHTHTHTLTRTHTHTHTHTLARTHARTRTHTHTHTHKHTHTCAAFPHDESLRRKWLGCFTLYEYHRPPVRMWPTGIQFLKTHINTHTHTHWVMEACLCQGMNSDLWDKKSCSYLFYLFLFCGRHQKKHTGIVRHKLVVLRKKCQNSKM